MGGKAYGNKRQGGVGEDVRDAVESDIEKVTSRAQGIDKAAHWIVGSGNQQ
jgi:hypothetical protein